MKIPIFIMSREYYSLIDRASVSKIRGEPLGADWCAANYIDRNTS
jgi:hypothetical protein